MSQLRIISRKEWNARPPKGPLTRVNQFSKVGIHYSTGQELGRTDTAQWVREIQLFHQSTNGWSDIGYHFLVDREGRIYEGRGWGFIGAHCPGRNADSIGICFLGNDDPGVDDLTPEAKIAIKLLIEEFEKRYMKPVEIFPHRRYKLTQCPGDEITKWIRDGLPIGESA